MMIRIGFYNELTLVKFTPQGAYLTDGTDEILLPAKYVTEEMAPGHVLRVFVYRDSLDRPVATTVAPLATAGQFACLRAKALTDVGAFLDWGLEKDLLVPFNQMTERMVPGRQYVVRVLVDDISDRIIATAKLRSFFDKNCSALSIHQKVSAMIFENRDYGSCAIIDNRYTGMFPKSEFGTAPAIGSVHTAFIKRISPDRKIDLTLAPSGSAGIQEAREELLQRLEEAGGFLPFNDSSPADEIQKNLHMSKKTFKRLVGNLMKKNLIELKEGGIRRR